jgi:glycosyltransferase involved in cell wall biosynthesis
MNACFPVSLAMIVRDGAATLETCLRSAGPWVSELIVVDTGSRDDSREIAERHGALVIDQPWCDDFSAARNRSLEACTQPWILFLDADEALNFPEPDRAANVWGAALDDNAVAGYELLLHNVKPTGERSSSIRTLRLFRASPEVRFQYPVHEQIIFSLAAWARPLGLSIAKLPVDILHSGYGVSRPDKLERNAAILRKAVTQQPGDPFLWYNLGKTLSHDHFKAGEEAVAALKESHRLLQGDAGLRETANYGPDLYHFLIELLLTAGKLDEALTVADEGVRFWWWSTEMLYERGNLLLGVGRFADAVEAFRDCAARTEEGGRLLAREDSFHSLALDGLGQALAYQGEWGESVAAFTEAIAAAPEKHTSRYNLAEVLKKTGQLRGALEQYMAIVSESPEEHLAWRLGAELLAVLGLADQAAEWRRRGNNGSGGGEP